MMSKIKLSIVIAMILAALAITGESAVAEVLQGITAPKADVTLSFVKAGRVDKIMVEPGATVAKDQILVRLYDEPEAIQCRQLKMLSEDCTRILAAEAELAQKKVDFKKVQQARAKGAASIWELEHLDLDMRIAELSLQAAKNEQAQYRQRYDHARSQLSRMRLKAPMGGLIEEISVTEGESIGNLGPVVRIVQNDPLLIDVPVPLTQAPNLRLNQDVWVAFPGSSLAHTSANGRIINISAVADAASETLRVRVEVPNPMKRPAGERVQVAFSRQAAGAVSLSKND